LKKTTRNTVTSLHYAKHKIVFVTPNKVQGPIQNKI